VRVETQAVFPEPQREDAHKAVGIVLTLKEGHRIVCVAQDHTVASAMARHYRGKPLVEGRIEEHVGNDRTDDGTLGAPQFVLHDTLSFPNIHHRGRSRRSDYTWLRRDPLVMVMKPSDFGPRDPLSVAGRLDRPRLWTVHRQRSMGSPGMVIGKAARQEALHMLRMPDNHLSQTRPPDTAHAPVHRGMLPWTLGSGPPFRDAQVLDPLAQGRTRDAGAIAEQRPGCLVPRKGFDHLWRGPRGCRMLGDVAVHAATAVVSQHHAHQEHPARPRRDDKAIQRAQLLPGVLQPGLPWRG